MIATKVLPTQQPNNSSCLTPRSVQFDPRISSVQYEKECTDSSAAWFNELELRAFRQDLIRNITMFRELSNGNDNPVLENSAEDYCILGIESLVYVPIAKKIIRAKRKVASSVFEEQNRQDQPSDDQGFGKAMRIGHVSSTHSEWARERAREMGLRYANIS